MKFIKPIIAFVIFIVMQVVASFALTTISLATNPNYEEALRGGGGAAAIFSTISPSLVATILLAANVLSIAVVSALGLIDWKSVFDWGRLKGKSILMPLLMGVLGCLSVNVFVEQFGVEDMMEDLFYNMMHSVWGIVVISILGPVLEELCFREAIVGGLLRRGAKPWVAILVSATLFGIIHANPAQSLAGFVIGVLLGVIYYKTGNIVLSSLFHICNNTLATVTCLCFDRDATFSSIVGGDAIAITIGAVLAVAAIVYFVKYWKQEPATPTMKEV